MTENLFSNFSFQVVVNLLVKLFWLFGIEVAVQNILGAEGYGQYYIAFNFTYMFFILLDMGLSNYNSRTVAGNNGQMKNLFPAMLSIKLVLATGYLFILFFASWLAGHEPEQRMVVMFIGFQQILMSLMLYFRSNISALHLFKTDALLSVLDRLVMGLICATLIWMVLDKEDFNLWHFLWAQFAGYMIAACIGLAAVLYHGVKLDFSFDLTLLKNIVKQSYPFAILFTLMTMYTRLDSVMLDFILPDGEYHSGIYASAFRFLDASVMFAVLLGNMLLPIFSGMLARKRRVDPVVKESFSIILLVAVILPLSTFFFAREIYYSLYPGYGEYGVDVTRLLFFNFIPMAMGYVFGTLLTAGNKLKMLNWISFAGLLLNITLNLILIPEHKALGATYATLCTQSIVALITFIICLKNFKLKLYDYLNWRVVLFGSASALIFWQAQMLNWFAWYVMWGMAIAISLFIAFFLKILSLKELFSRFKPAYFNDSNLPKT